ncbi:DNA polymerase III alpha subunit [Phyllobacterium trifolii]|uniref:DNA polymerase III alpha subunit n=1 Tax=Phyllobacterium trifolii TaxID=300193 RepID=A0A839UEY0_9HYPH|nr:DNA polymerase III alpha subunit [Phyllobacterium trifolii]
MNTADYRLELALDLSSQLMGAPRHPGQHPGGFVLTQDGLDDLVPIEPATMQDRQVVEWDKDDIEALQFMKVDVLALGMLTCMAKSFDLLRDHKNIPMDLSDVEQEDPPRLKPRTFYDLVVQVAMSGRDPSRATWCIHI